MYIKQQQKNSYFYRYIFLMVVKKRIPTLRIKAGFESSYCWSHLRQYVVILIAKSSLHSPFRCRSKDIFKPTGTENGTGPNSRCNGVQSNLYLNK